MLRLRPTRLLVLPLVLALLAAGCGDDDDTGAPGGPPSDQAPADGDGDGPVTFVGVDIAWEDPPATLPAGGVEVTLDNAGAIEHSLLFEGSDVRLLAQPGDVVTEEVDLEPGTVYYYCDIPGHEDAGMAGEIEVV